MQIIDALQQQAPDATIELVSGQRKLFVVASEADHAKIAASLASLTAKRRNRQAGHQDLPYEEPAPWLWRTANRQFALYGDDRSR